MIELNIPGRGTLQLEHLVFDVNGSLALDGQLLEGVPRLLRNLRDRLTIHLVTADTHGRQALIDQQLGLQAVRLAPGGEAGQKAEYVRRLGADRVVAIGQGANDAAMLKEAALASALSHVKGWQLRACKLPTCSSRIFTPPWSCWKSLCVSCHPCDVRAP